MIITTKLIVISKRAVKLKINANPAYAFLSWIIRCHLQLLTLCATLRSKFSCHILGPGILLRWEFSIPSTARHTESFQHFSTTINYCGLKL